MRILALFIFCLTLATAPIKTNAATQSTPEVYGVLFYADWCGSCEILDPKIEEARATNDLDTKDVLFVRLDLTDDTTKHQAALMAETLGLTTFYNENAGKTGFMLLVDADTGEALGKLTKDMSSADITSHIQSASQKASTPITE